MCAIDAERRLRGGCYRGHKIRNPPYLFLQVNHKVCDPQTRMRVVACYGMLKCCAAIGDCMYIQPPFVQHDVERMHTLIREYPLGTLVTQSAAGLEANHLPFLLAASDGSMLTAHLPRANPI